MTDRTVDGKIIEVIFPPEQINRRISELAQDIHGAALADPLVISILKGSFIFAADLIRALHVAGLSPQVDFMTLSSYGTGQVSSGAVSVVRDFDVPVTGRDVLLVDDILESGRTLAFARDLILSRGARRVLSCVLLDKPVGERVGISADFRAFDCPDVFVVGYGMDAAYRYRQLPYVGRVKNEDEA
ncbi:MAG: hypoxanthine phosphoribosyltransferase [Hyphomicrobiaceae bacterium]|nr:hypoxanthine phosphoribosyltransferase [Hyphomicrobiaceae bacterium]